MQAHLIAIRLVASLPFSAPLIQSEYSSSASKIQVDSATQLQNKNAAGRTSTLFACRSQKQ